MQLSVKKGYVINMIVEGDGLKEIKYITKCPYCDWKYGSFWSKGAHHELRNHIIKEHPSIALDDLIEVNGKDNIGKVLVKYIYWEYYINCQTTQVEEIKL